jgi:uroporphyrin-III C-methyltransferase
MDERDYQGWQGLTRAGHTLVFYMGLERAAQIRQGLLAAGASLDVPVALVVAGCNARQQVHETTLDGLAQAALALLGQSPVLIIVGEVVRLRAELQGLLTEALDRVA